jgi:hypothetical protein
MTLAGFFAIADVHETIPLLHSFPWLTAPIVWISDAFGILKSDAAYWVAFILGFALWVFLFALLFSSSRWINWWISFKKSLPKVPD